MLIEQANKYQLPLQTVKSHHKSDKRLRNLQNRVNTLIHEIANESLTKEEPAALKIPVQVKTILRKNLSTMTRV